MEYCCSCCCGSTFTALSPDARKERWRRVFRTIEDRTRIPWIGGARQANAGVVAAPMVFWALQTVCGAIAWAPWVLLWLAVVAAHLIWLQLMCLSLPWRTDYFISWTACSIGGLYYVYVEQVLPTQHVSTVLLGHVLLVMVIAAYISAILHRPLSLRPIDVTADGTIVDIAIAGTDRCYPCKVCGYYITRRDHHCVWINQCIGVHNHRSFLAFVLGLPFLCVAYAIMVLRFSAASSGTSVMQRLVYLWHEQQLPALEAGVLYALGCGIFAAALSLGQICSISAGMTTHEIKRASRKGTSRSPHPHTCNRCYTNWMTWWCECKSSSGTVRIDSTMSCTTKERS